LHFFSYCIFINKHIYLCICILSLPILSRLLLFPILCSFYVVLFVRNNTLLCSIKANKAVMSLHCINYLKCFSHPFTVRHRDRALKVTSVEVVET
jgi:hypothetical protein